MSKIVSIEEIEYEHYVYDFETFNNHFQVGDGGIIVHNTDSIFFTPKIDKSIKEKNKILKYAIDIGVLVGKEITEKIGMYPHDLEYEKTFLPLILKDKKNYEGRKYEFDTNKYKDISSGSAGKKRGYCKMTKHIYNNTVQILFNTQSANQALKFIMETLNDMIDGKYDVEYFVITKNLKSHSSYKKPESIAHRVLADRVALRDAGKAYQSNERIPYVFIEVERGSKYVKVIGEDIEVVDYVKEMGLKLDYLRYLNKQIKTPMIKIMDLLINDSENIFKQFEKEIIAERKKKWIKYDNKKNKQPEITNFFRKI